MSLTHYALLNAQPREKTCKKRRANAVKNFGQSSPQELIRPPSVGWPSSNPGRRMSRLR